MDQDDIASELWIHIFENMPQFESLEDNEIKALASTILKNKSISLYRKHSSKTKKSVSFVVTTQDDVELSLENILSLEMINLGLKIFDRGLHHLNQCEILEYKELVSVIEKWANNQDKLAKKLVLEILNPSEDTLVKWRGLVEKFSIYRSYEYIPYCSFTRILGISRPKIIKVMKALRAYLESVYQEDFAAILQ